MDYENVYVAQVAYGAKDVHTLKAFIEAESFPSLNHHRLQSMYCPRR